jgi:hypothetical protein
MPNLSERLRPPKATRCAVCDRKFGLLRHYSWQTPLCSTECVDRFRARHQSDLEWVGLHESSITFFPANSSARAS